MKKKKMQKKIYYFCQTLPRKYATMISMAALLLVCASPSYAVEDMWTVGREIITDIYSQIAGISTVLAGLMSAVAVLGCKFPVDASSVSISRGIGSRESGLHGLSSTASARLSPMSPRFFRDWLPWNPEYKKEGKHPCWSSL